MNKTNQAQTTKTNDSKSQDSASQPTLNTARNGAEILIKTLEDLQVDTVFGYPGGAVLPVYDKLFDKNGLNHILIRHEQAGSHAADGYARATGKPGVVLVTSGPGGTNTVTGIATAAMDSIPMVVFTGQVPSNMIGKDAFQEADIVGITRPITKHNYQVKDVNKLEKVIREAFHVATSGRPGPVLVDLPKDMLQATGHYSGIKKVSTPGYDPVTEGHQPQIEKAAQLLEDAKRPLVYAGGGIILGEAWEELTTMVERLNVPITTTIMGLGAFPESKPQALGMLGMHGNYSANMAISECDVLLAVGARFDDRVTGDLKKFSPHSQKIHIDIDPSCIGKNVPVEVPIVGDVKNILPVLDEKTTKPETDRWWQTVNNWRDNHPLKAPRSDDEIMPQHMIEAISEVTDGEAIIVTDVGQHQMWAAQLYNYNHPRSYISSGGLGTMGYGFPAAMGAKLGSPDRDVFCVTGDGGFQMTAYELSTAVENNVPVKIAIMNNGCLGMVRQWQELFYDERYSHTILNDVNPDFVKLAESYGCAAFRATTPDEMYDVLDKAMNIDDGPVVMEFVVPEQENCFPMVPTGAALTETIEEAPQS